MIDPVFAADGHTYEREAMEEWLKTHDTSPKTNLKLKHRDLIENHDKRGDILEFLGQYPEFYEEEVYLPKYWVSGLVAVIKANKIKEVQELLIKDKRLLTAKLEGDYTALHLACQFGSLELANILLESLIKKNALDKILRQSPAGFKPVYLNVLLQFLKAQANRIEQLEREVAQIKKKPEDVKERGESETIGTFFTPLRSALVQQPSKEKQLPDLKVTAEEVQKFLNHVAAGEQNEAEAMLKQNRDLVLAIGTVTDHAKRTFKNITGFQYAVWALDWEMWRMIRKYLSKEAAQEQARGFAEGSWVKEYGEHADWKKLTEAQQTLIDNWGPWDWEKINEYWVQQVGGAQLLLPMHVLQEYDQPGRPFFPCPNFYVGYGLDRQQVEWLNVGGVSKLGIRVGLLKGRSTASAQPYTVSNGIPKSQESCDFVYQDRATLLEMLRTRTQQRTALVAELAKKPGVSPSK